MRPFRRTLIMKLMGRQLSYGFMVKKLRQLWERKGKIDVFDLQNEFFLVNFQHMEDYMGALTGGPWVILDAYLNMARWRPDFYPKNERIESVVAWVRLPGLPALLFDKKFLLNLGNALGKAIRMDVHTAQRARGKFARMLCKKCGWVGHTKEACTKFHKKKNGMRVDEEVLGKNQMEENSMVEEKELWKTVQRPRRPRKFPVNPQSMQSGSFYCSRCRSRGRGRSKG
ncbi:hypothetical protein K1719_030726 [Acacia pycnantha]|nr:hypothetical protein K1719_030726 [Acacia pycnantha]